MTRTALRGLFALPLLAAFLAAGCSPRPQPSADPDKAKEQPRNSNSVDPSKQGKRPMAAAAGMQETNPGCDDIGLDADLAQAVEVEKEADFHIDAPVVEPDKPAAKSAAKPDKGNRIRNVIALCGGGAAVPLISIHGELVDLTNPDLGLDSDLQAAVEVEKEKDINVNAPVVEGDAIGLPNLDPTTNGLGAFGLTNDALGGPGAIGGGLAMHGLQGTGVLMGAGSGNGGGLAMPGLQGRSGVTKEKLLRQGGGSDTTEAAVARALLWLAKQQNVTGGYWEFDGSAKGDRIAATGMCLLPFLGAGETHKSAKRYKENVRRGLDYLRSQVKPNGQLSASMYSQAIATMALCEAAGMTRDAAIKRIAQLAVDCILQAQSGDGSWGYTAGTQGDTSITGWQIQALRAARLAEIPVPQKAFDQAAFFLESVSGDSGATYGYRTKGSIFSLTAVGLLSRYYMGWKPDNPSLQKGVAFLAEKLPSADADADFNMYYYYYGTQIMFVAGGQAWQRDWNPKMTKLLLGKQVTDKTQGAKVGDIGSFPADSAFIGKSGGKLGTTALACLTLEVYYRLLPRYKRDSPPDEKK